MAEKKRNLMVRRRLRVRNRLKKNSSGHMRLSVFRSNKNISAQLIDDQNGLTLASASSREAAIGGGNSTSVAAKVGTEIATRAKKAGIETVVFDRGPYLFHGKVKALAEAAREGGLKF